MRRNDSTGELAYYRCYHLGRVPLGELVRVAGQRWTIEKSFQAATGQAGLDEHQVRTWKSWHRWTVLCMLSMAFLAAVTAAERDRTPTPEGMIGYTLNEIRRLFDALATGPATKTHDHILHWSQWRRRHQATAREMPLSPQVGAPGNPNHPCRTSVGTGRNIWWCSLSCPGCDGRKTDTIYS